MDEPLERERVVPQLWRAYQKTPEYAAGRQLAIPARHPLVIRQEKFGLRSIYDAFVHALSQRHNAAKELANRSIGDWLEQWKEMHHFLFRHIFRHILRQSGQWREHDIRFGAPGDELLHRIPTHHDVPRAIQELAYLITQQLSIMRTTDEERYRFLALVHYQFVRIHPFPDGNGRIARAVTDQLAVHFGYPPAMAGYPRHQKEQREVYHRAITACVEDPNCTLLAQWIHNYIERSIAQAA